jgi:hypothetical protein
MTVVTLVAHQWPYAKFVYDRATNKTFVLDVPTEVDDDDIARRLESVARLGYVFTYGAGEPAPAEPAPVAPAPAIQSAELVPAA